MSRSESAVIESLRARIWALERSSSAPAEVLPLAGTIDASLPWGGLPLACLHEIVAGDGAGIGFAAVLLGRLTARGPVLWCRLRHAGEGLYPPGLEAFGLDGDGLIVVNGRDRVELLWAMEEGLRCPKLGAVVAEVATLDLTAGRRLQLAAEAGGVTGFLLLPRPVAAAGTTRWRVSAAPSAETPWQGIGDARWHLSLERCRGGVPRAWTVEWQAEARRLVVLGD
jgi:protein ImuA